MTSARSVPPFLGEDASAVALDQARAVILPVAYEKTVSWGGGTGRGPRALLEASASVELFDEELRRETCRIGIHTHAELESDQPPAVFLPELQAVHARAAGAGDRLVAMLGGEHSITLAAVESCLQRHPDLHVLQFDAHADLRDSYGGTPFSHASVMRRVSEKAPIVQVGIRSLSSGEADWMQAGAGNHAVHTHWMHDGWPGDLSDWVLDRLGDPVYITFDLDVLDPSVLPSTGTPEPGGIDWYRATRLLRAVARRRRIVGFDVVELAPVDGHPASDFLAAKLTYRMLGYCAESAGWAC